MPASELTPEQAERVKAWLAAKVGPVANVAGFSFQLELSDCGDPDEAMRRADYWLRETRQ